MVKLKPLTQLVTECKEGDVVLLHFKDGTYAPLVYAKILPQADPSYPVEILFVNTPDQIHGCESRGDYHKTTLSGVSPMFPGNPVVGYELLKRASDILSAQSSPKCKLTPIQTTYPIRRMPYVPNAVRGLPLKGSIPESADDRVDARFKEEGRHHGSPSRSKR